jgi:hypothetical protein
MTMPAMPGSGFVMVEPEFVLGGLEAVLDRPTMALDFDHCLDRRPCRTPSAKIGEIAVGDMAPDQQTTRPQAMAVIVEFLTREIGQFEVAPVVQPRSFGSCAG